MICLIECFEIKNLTFACLIRNRFHVKILFFQLLFFSLLWLIFISSLAKDIRLGKGKLRILRNTARSFFFVGVGLAMHGNYGHTKQKGLTPNEE